METGLHSVGSAGVYRYPPICVPVTGYDHENTVRTGDSSGDCERHISESAELRSFCEYYLNVHPFCSPDRRAMSAV
jgi:hypothetical protein